MNHDHSQETADFRDRLLAAEPLTRQSQHLLQQELHSMFTRQLSTPRRIMFGIVALFALMSGTVCGALSLTEPELPPLARLGLATGALIGLAWTVVTIGICKRGMIDLKIDNRRLAAMAWVFTILMMVFFLMVGMSASDQLQGLLMITSGLAFLIGAAVYWLTHRIEQSELTTREAILRLELQIAKLCEQK